MTAMRCNCCQRNLPAGCFRLRQRKNDRGYKYSYREQPCKQCRSYVNPPTEAYRERQRAKRKERYWKKKRAEQIGLNKKHPLPKRNRLPLLHTSEMLFVRCRWCGDTLSRSAFREPGYMCWECHKADASARKAKRRAEDPEWHAEELAKLKAWKKANPERSRLGKRLHDKRRTAFMVENGKCTFTEEEWHQLLKIYNYRCFYCGQRGGSKTRDHIVPLAKGGEHTMENIVPCCASCNSHKRQLDLKEFILLRMAA